MEKVEPIKYIKMNNKTEKSLFELAIQTLDQVTERIKVNKSEFKRIKKEGAFEHLYQAYSKLPEVREISTNETHLSCVFNAALMHEVDMSSIGTSSFLEAERAIKKHLGEVSLQEEIVRHSKLPFPEVMVNEYLALLEELPEPVLFHNDEAVQLTVFTVAWNHMENKEV